MCLASCYYIHKWWYLKERPNCCSCWECFTIQSPRCRLFSCGIPVYKFPMLVETKLGFGLVTITPLHWHLMIFPCVLHTDIQFPLAMPLASQHSFLTRKTNPFGPKEESLGRIAQIFSQTVSSDNTDKSSKNVSKSYLKKITSGLNFSDDVVDSWAPYAKPYNESDPVRVYNTTGISHRKTKSIGLVGRHDPPGSVRKHGPCYLKGPRKLKPLKRSSSAQDKTLNESSFNKLRISEETQYTNKPASRVVSQHEWDEHVLASIS